MWAKLLCTKERKTYLSLLALASIIISLTIVWNIYETKIYDEQAVMAKEYLSEGNYDKAVEAYQKALTMSKSNQEEITLGLAEAYIGIKNYDMALEVLRTCYQKTAGSKIKEKIEEVTLQKIDFEFQDIITRADKFYSKNEYDKAIATYEKAKLKKSKEAISYQKIAEAYIEKGEYNLALEELEEGIEITSNDSLNITLNRVDLILRMKQYEEILIMASEYFYQENYYAAIDQYRAAIDILPKEEKAYVGLVETYLEMKDYETVLQILNETLKIVKSTTLLDLKETSEALFKEEKKRKSTLLDLYEALNSRDIDKTKEIMKTSIFKKYIVRERPVYYNSLGVEDQNIQYGLIIYDKNTLYAGRIENGFRDGIGIYIQLSQDKGKMYYYYYDGEWNDNIPEGLGRTEEEIRKVDSLGETYTEVITTIGSFYKARENGTMKKFYYKKEKERFHITYTITHGKPIPLQDDNGNPLIQEDRIVISVMYREYISIGQYYKVHPGVIWGVKPFL